MAYYNANLVIGLTRKALGITQEKLSEGICAVETYSRIENGHHAVRKSTYRKLMKKMGRIAETRYTVCVAEDGVLLEERIELERALKRYDYEAAEKYLQKLKEKADDNLLTRQYVAREEAFVDYRKGRITAKDLLTKLDEVMRITMPEYEEYLEEGIVFPFVKSELITLMNMGNTYRRIGELDKALNIYKALSQCLDANYIGNPDKTTLQITVSNNLSLVYEAEGKNELALNEINTCLNLASINDYGNLMVTLLSAKAHNIVKMVEKEEWEEEQLNEAKNLLRQAFFIAVARGESTSAQSIEKYYIMVWGELEF